MSAVQIKIKNLAGHLIYLDVEPKKGLPGVREALSKHDPEHFPFTRIVILNTDEMNPPLTNESELMVFVHPEDQICSIVSIEDEELPGTNLSYSVFCRHWHFRLENEKNCHVYRTLVRPKLESGSYANYMITEGALKLGVVGTAPSIMDALTSKDWISPRDAFIIKGSIERHDCYPITKRESLFDNTKRMRVFCECGHIVMMSSMKQHRNTKTKHIVGYKEGIEFMQRAEKYLKDWSS